MPPQLPPAAAVQSCTARLRVNLAAMEAAALDGNLRDYARALESAFAKLAALRAVSYVTGGADPFGQMRPCVGCPDGRLVPTWAPPPDPRSAPDDFDEMSSHHAEGCTYVARLAALANDTHKEV